MLGQNLSADKYLKTQLFAEQRQPSSKVNWRNVNSSKSLASFKLPVQYLARLLRRG